MRRLAREAAIPEGPAAGAGVRAAKSLDLAAPSDAVGYVKNNLRK
jgi:hypothetical protein